MTGTGIYSLQIQGCVKLNRKLAMAHDSCDMRLKGICAKQSPGPAEVLKACKREARQPARTHARVT